jgi:hypothetical protein
MWVAKATPSDMKNRAEIEKVLIIFYASSAGPILGPLRAGALATRDRADAPSGLNGV